MTERPMTEERQDVEGLEERLDRLEWDLSGYLDGHYTEAISRSLGDRALAALRTLREQVERLRGGHEQTLEEGTRNLMALRARAAAAEARADALQREVEALRAGQEQRCIAHAAFNPDGDCVFCDNDILQERVAELEADRERLDLLKRSGSFEVEDYVGGPVVFHCGLGEEHRAPTLREAIDAARALDTKGGE